jgi:hypothetical protein
VSTALRYRRPAVYIERVDAARQQPILLRTDVAGFVGIARRGPVDTPVPVESFRQFAAHFGEFTGAGYLAYAVRGFFENGGSRCWIVRVANRDEIGGAQTASTALADIAGEPALHVSASSAGTWGNALSVEIGIESGAVAVGIPGQMTARYATVDSVAQFEPSALARIEGSGIGPVYRVVSAVDAERRRIYWTHPVPGAALPTDLALIGIDLTQPLRISRIAYAITVREAGVVRAVFRDLHLVPTHPRFAPRMLAAPTYPLPWHAAADEERPADVPRPARPIVLELDERASSRRPLDVTPGAELRLSGGRDGLATLSPYDFIGEAAAPADSDFVKSRKRRGLQPLADVDEIALVAIPDVHIQPDIDPSYEPVAPPVVNPCVTCPPPAPQRRIHQPLSGGELPPTFDLDAIGRMQAALVEHCEQLGDRFAILSLPFRLATEPIVSRDEIMAWRRRFETSYGALYAPWLDVVEPRRTTPTRRIPSCGHVTGAIARTDLSSGVHRAPGNVVLDGVTDVSRRIGDTDHGELNEEGINVVQVEFGRLPVVGGARTLSHDPDWRFINVVRLVLTLKKAIDMLLRWVVFEPNTHETRAAVAATLIALLQLFHERGAFKGATPEESYYVRCDDVTTPSAARDAGQLIALVGIAPAAPCEFIVLRVGKERNTLTVDLFGETEVAHA